ncbi:MAG: DUF4384 domain-containing protein [Pseudomonadota bacterium]
MADELMDSLKKAFMKENDKSGGECPMTDQATAYAFGELAPEEAEKVKEHIHECRHCLDLVMDIRVAEEEAESLKGQPVEVVAGLQKAIDKGKAHSLWDRIGNAVSGFFGPGFGLKPVAAFAVLVMCVGIFVMWDKDGVSPGKPYSIEILLQGRTQTGFRGGKPEYRDFKVEPGGKMQSGDYFRLQTQIDKDAFVYLVFQDSAGKIDAMEKGRIAGGQMLSIPDGDNWFQLDTHTGTEKLFLVASKDKIADFAQRVDELKKMGIGNIEKVFPKTTVKSFSFEHR